MRTFLNRKLTGLVILSSLLIGVSCNSGDTKKDDASKTGETSTADTAVQPALQPAGQPAALTAGPFTVLRLEKQSLLDLFQNGNTKKLLIQFSDNGTQFMQAVAFAAKANNDYQNVMKNITPASTQPWDTTGVKILGNNEFTEKQIKKLIGGAINATNAKDLYFYPIKDANNQIYFIVSTRFSTMEAAGSTTTLDYPPDGEASKPSPPAPPCTSCD